VRGEVGTPDGRGDARAPGRWAGRVRGCHKVTATCPAGGPSRPQSAGDFLKGPAMRDLVRLRRTVTARLLGRQAESDSLASALV
jgi:hypothetical protein